MTQPNSPYEDHVNAAVQAFINANPIPLSIDAHNVYVLLNHLLRSEAEPALRELISLKHELAHTEQQAKKPTEDASSVKAPVKERPTPNPIDNPLETAGDCYTIGSARILLEKCRSYSRYDSYHLSTTLSPHDEKDICWFHRQLVDAATHGVQRALQTLGINPIDVAGKTDRHIASELFDYGIAKRVLQQAFDDHVLSSPLKTDSKEFAVWLKGILRYGFISGIAHVKQNYKPAEDPSPATPTVPTVSVTRHDPRSKFIEVMLSDVIEPWVYYYPVPAERSTSELGIADALTAIKHEIGKQKTRYERLFEIAKQQTEQAIEATLWLHNGKCRRLLTANGVVTEASDKWSSISAAQTETLNTYPNAIVNVVGRKVNIEAQNLNGKFDLLKLNAYGDQGHLPGRKPT